MRPETIDPQVSSPFSSDENAYHRWREWKCSHPRLDADLLRVDIADPSALSASELDAIRQRIIAYNMVVYRLIAPARTDSTLVTELGAQLGLVSLDHNLRADEDRVTRLEDRPQSGNQYIPYTSKALSWHTDGYYNPEQRRIGAVILHCVTPAASGGENRWMDHERLYMRLRDEDPALIRALMHPQAMTIPANLEGDVELRPAQSGPVFSVDAHTGRLHMRYSARMRNIEWRDDADTLRARSLITEWLQDDSLMMHHRMRANEGIIGNNVLHDRSAFEDSTQHRRLLYRARYHESIV